SDAFCQEYREFAKNCIQVPLTGKPRPGYAKQADESRRGSPPVPTRGATMSEAKARLTKEMICEEARFILANVLAEGRYGKQNHLDDIRRICEGAVSLGLDEYIVFLENYGYLNYDRRSDILDVTAEGERVVSGEKTQDLIARVMSHFLSRPSGPPAASHTVTASRRSR